MKDKVRLNALAVENKMDKRKEVSSWITEGEKIGVLVCYKKPTSKRLHEAKWC